MRFDYSVVRFVPDTFKGEFVNVGLIVGSSEAGQWRVRRLSNWERARRFRNGAPIRAVLDYLDGLEDLAKDAEEAAEVGSATNLDVVWLASEHRRLNNLVQLTVPRAVAGDDVVDAVAMLWDTLFVDPERSGYTTPAPARQALLRAYQSVDVDTKLIHRNCHAERGHQHVKVDFAIGNGHLAQLAQAWSFRGAQLDRTLSSIRDWSWILRDVREQHGSIRVGDDHEYPLDDAVPIRVVHDEPDTDEGKWTLDAAYEVFEGLDAQPVPARDAGDVARQARHALDRDPAAPSP